METKKLFYGETLRAVPINGNTPMMGNEDTMVECGIIEIPRVVMKDRKKQAEYDRSVVKMLHPDKYDKVKFPNG